MMLRKTALTVGFVAVSLLHSGISYADGSHGPVALRLGVGAPLDNNIRDWKDVSVVNGISYYLNHKSGTSLMTAIDLDTNLAAKKSVGGRAMGVSYTLRKITADDGRYRTYIGGGVGLFRVTYRDGSGESSEPSRNAASLGGKAVYGRMDSHGHFVELAYTYSGSSIANGLGATFGLRF